MLCSELRPLLLAPDGPLTADQQSHLSSCPTCTKLAAASARFDSALRSQVVLEPSPTAVGEGRVRALSPRLDAVLQSNLVAAPPAGVQARLLELAQRQSAPARADAAVRAALQPPVPLALQVSLASLAEQAGATVAVEGRQWAGETARAQAALRAALLPEPPAALQGALLATAQAEGQAMLAARADAALQGGLVAAPPATVRARLLELVPEAGSQSWFARLLGRILPVEGMLPRLGVVAGEVAALGVLAYALFQVVLWIASLPIVLGNVPYALELLIWSPAVDYLAQVQSLLQQLGLWLLVAGVGWLAAQGLPWRQSATGEPS